MAVTGIAATKGLAAKIAANIVQQTADSPDIRVSNRFVPWRDGQNINGTDKWGFTWYLMYMDFRGINTSGKYLIQNGCDAYLVLGNIPLGIESLSLFQDNVVPPNTSGIYLLDRNSFVITCICAGYDFTTARGTPGDNARFLLSRGPLAYVEITSLGIND